MAIEAERPRHPVRVVSERTGLTAATLRAWERRYGAVAPARSEGGQRLYSDADVERLKLLRALTEGGRPIRLVAGLGIEAARALLGEDRRGAAPAGPQGNGAGEVLAEAMALTRALDGEGLQAMLRRAVVAAGALSFLDQIVGPFLVAVGEAWASGSIGPAEEHLAAVAVESVLAWLTDSAGESAGGPTLAVGTLPEEQHRLGARMVAASAALEGWRVAYLGADLPGVEIARAARAIGAAAVAVSVVAREPSPRSRAELRDLSAELPPGTPVFIGGAGAPALVAAGPTDGLVLLDGLPALREALRRRR